MNLFCGGKFSDRVSSEMLLAVSAAGPPAFFFPEIDISGFLTCPFWKSVHFLIFGDFSKNGSPGQTTMLTTSAAKFCVEPRSPFSNIFHHELKSIGKPRNIVSRPESQLEFFREALKSTSVVRRAGSEGCTTASRNP